jgi:hypothetical protein
MSASGSVSSNRRWLSAVCGGITTGRRHGASSGRQLGFVGVGWLSLRAPWPAGLRLPGPAGTALSRGVEAPVCLRRLVFMIRRVRKINIGRYLDREPGLPISGNHPRLTFWAAGDRHQEGPLTADDQHECVGTEMGREDLGVGDHDRFRAVLLITLRRWR